MCADIFENISQTVKKEKYRPEPDTLRVREREKRTMFSVIILFTLQDQEPPSERVALADKQKGLFEVHTSIYHKLHQSRSM